MPSSLPDLPARAPTTAAPTLEGRRIVFVLNYAVLGGAERQALLVASHLARHEGASVAVCALTDGEGSAKSLSHERGIPWRSLPLSWADSRLERIRRLADFMLTLRRLQPDVVMPYCTVPNVACGLVWP